MNRTATIFAFAGVLLTAGAVWKPAANALQTVSAASATDAQSQTEQRRRPDLGAVRRGRGFDERLAADAPLELNGEFADRILMIADEIDPELSQRLRAMCDHDPAEFARTIRTSGRTLVGLAELQVRDPDLYELKVSELKIEGRVARLQALLDQAYRAEDDEQIQSLEKELRFELMVQLALSIKARGDYLMRLQEHVRALEAEIERDATHFEETVDNRLREIVERSRMKDASPPPGP